MGNYFRLESDDELDTREIEQYGLEGVEYTPNAQEAIDVVDQELATIAFLVRAPSVATVMETALGGEVMPPKTTYFRPKLTSGLLLHPVLSPWLELCRAAVRDVEAVLVEMPTREERERPIGRGKGGDITAALDEAAESVILKHFDLPDVRIVSEEIGIKGEGALTVCVDPIDGSQNAERAIPYFALCVAVAEGRTMDDVVFGFVHDFGSGEEWTAVRGGGAFLNGAPLTGRPKDEIQFMSIEATRGDLVYSELAKLAPLTDRVRIMGAQAITFCHLAAGRTDAVVCPEAVAQRRLRRVATARP